MIWWIVDDAPIVGGAELFGLRLGAELQTAGDTVVIATPQASPFADRARNGGLTVVDAPLAPLTPPRAAQVIGLPLSLLATRALLRRARSAGAAVVANTAGAQAYVVLAATTLRSPPPLVHLLHEQMTAARPTARAAFRRGGALVATGANTAAVYRAALPGLEVGQLNNFVADELFLDAPPRRVAEPPVVGILARMIPEKGVREAVDELAATADLWSYARLAAPPQDADYAAAVRARIQQHGLDDRIDVLDWAEPSALLDSVDVLLVPSTGLEGQPTVILEGLARGRAVVVRAPMWSEDFEGLPVVRYTTPEDLGRVLATPPSPTEETLSEARTRFGPEQAVDAIRAAARRAR